MNKNLHIFLFLLFILIIFCVFKDIEPFGNQALLQPGLSFDSRDTSIISLQKILKKIIESHHLIIESHHLGEYLHL